MSRVTIHEAKTHLSKLIRRAMQGEEIVISRGNEPLVKLVPLRVAGQKRVIGDYKGRIEIADDFAATPEDFEEYT